MLEFIFKIIKFLTGISLYTVAKSYKHISSREPIPRSGKWPTVRKNHLKLEPCCQWCGGLLDLEVHHEEPFHMNPANELKQDNLITLCERVGRRCHYEKGHNGTSWHDFNPNIRKQCSEHRNK